MKLSYLKQIIDRITVLNKHEDPEVVVEITLPYSTIGANPCVEVKSANLGFDWNKGKFIFNPSERLTKHDEDFAKQFSDLQEKYGWLQYENRNLKSEIKKLKGK